MSCLYFQSDVPMVRRAGNTSRMAKLCLLTRTKLLKITAVLVLLSSLLSFSELLAVAGGNDDYTWRSKVADGHRINANLPSPGRLGTDSARWHFNRSGVNSGESKLTDDFLEVAHRPTSALSFIHSFSGILQRRSLAALSPTPQLALSSGPSQNLEGFVCGICGESYTAVLGDTLLSVAVYCNISLEQVRRDNPGSEKWVNITSKEIKIPCTGSSGSNCTRCGHSAIIKVGDTLDQVATRCNLTIEMVETANPSIDYSNIFPNQYITLPCVNGTIVENVTGCGVCGRGLTVETDGFIDDVAIRCNVSANKLLEANPAINATTRSIIQGQFVRVPCSGNDSANCGPCGSNYTTIRGDSIMLTAAKCRVGYIELTNINPGVDLSQGEENLHLLIPCDSVPQPVVCSPCTPNHFSSESVEISTIATTCNVSTAVIAYANSLPLSGIVPAGKNISIPCATLPRRNLRNCGNCGSSFTLASQVTLEAIAGACGTTVAAIRAENGNFSFDLLGPKDEISLPCNIPQVDCGPCGIGYKTDYSDTLESVAVKCATPADQIIWANPVYDFRQPLSPNQILHIPCAPVAGSGSSSSLLLQPLGCSSQVLHVLIMLTIWNKRFIWYYLR